MRTRTVTLVEFDGVEFQTLRRVEPSIRIAFPTVLPARDAKAQKIAQREWAGRWLHNVCSRQQEWDAKQIWAAWDAAVTLEAVLEAQSDRAYWERELIVRYDRELERATPIQQGAVGLVAPGTDVCGMLAESRASQLRDTRDALAILAEARDVVGPVPGERIPIRTEGV